VTISVYTRAWRVSVRQKRRQCRSVQSMHGAVLNRHGLWLVVLGLRSVT